MGLATKEEGEMFSGMIGKGRVSKKRCSGDTIQLVGEYKRLGLGGQLQKVVHPHEECSELR